MVKGLGSTISYNRINNFTGQGEKQVDKKPANSAQQNDFDNLALDRAKDEMKPGDILTKTRIGVEQASMVPSYVKRGLQGDPESNFFEFLKIAKIPYYIGGPMLAYCFAAGGGGAAGKVRKALVGAAMYYLAPVVANVAVTTPLKVVRGVDLNAPARIIVHGRSGYSNSRKEYHKVFESVDFPRWDLLYRDDQEAFKDPKLANQRYENIAKKIGLKEDDLNNPDSAVKPYVKKMIVQSRAWKTLITIPLIVMALGIANSQQIENNSIKGFKKDIKSGKLRHFGHSVKTLFKSTVIDASKAFWNGNGSKLWKRLNRTLVVGTALAMVVANVCMLRTSSAKHKKTVDAKDINSTKQDPRSISILNKKQVAPELGGKQ